MRATAVALAVTLLLASLALARSAHFESVDDPDFQEHFASWCVQHDKFYDTDMLRAKAMKVYFANIAVVESMNAAQVKDGGDEVFDVDTPYMDMTQDEFHDAYLMPEWSPADADVMGDVAAADVPSLRAPSAFTWEGRGVLSAIKSQGECGSCW